MLVDANRELVVRFEHKIRTTLARIWGEEEPGVVAAVDDQLDVSEDQKQVAAR